MRALKERRDVSVERVEEDAPQLTVAADTSPAELDAEARAEQALGVQRDWQPDLSGVTVHDGDVARTEADAIGAAAFTRGTDIYLGSAYEAGTPHGDHVLAHELAHTQQDNPTDEVHRYPATALQSGPVEWSQMTRSVFRPPGGVSGGVYILTSSNPSAGTAKVVVKPVMGASGKGTKESGESLQFGDRVLREILGIASPVSRVVQKGTAEYGDLMGIVTPYAPPKPEITDDMSQLDKLQAEAWMPIESAKSFLVMGEVPNAKTLSGLTKAAATDQTAMAQLWRTIFDQDFITDFGKMCIGDMLIGNNDRFVVGAQNLGNLMVSMGENKSTLYSIDTNSVLPEKDVNPRLLQDMTASKSGAGVDNVRKGWAAGSPAKFAQFLRVLVGTLEDATPQTEGPSPIEPFKQALTRRTKELEGWFEDGWSSALLELYAMANSEFGQQKMKGMTDDYQGTPGEDDISYTALHAGASLLGSVAVGEQEETVNKQRAIAAIRLASGFDTKDIPPQADHINPNVATVPGGSALTAQIEKPATLVGPAEIPNIKYGASFQRNTFTKVTRSADAAKAEVGQMGTKQRGVFNKKEQPRNRVAAAEYVANVYLLSAGADRAATSAWAMGELAGLLAIAAPAAEPSQVPALSEKARHLKANRGVLDTQLGQYEGALNEAAATIPKMHINDETRNVKGGDAKFKASLADRLSSRFGPLEAVDRGKTGYLAGVDQADPDALLAMLARRATATLPSPEAKNKGRRNMLGRGRR